MIDVWPFPSAMLVPLARATRGLGSPTLAVSLPLCIVHHTPADVPEPLLIAEGSDEGDFVVGVARTGRIAGPTATPRSREPIPRSVRAECAIVP